ncbi:MAG: Imm49 family immunity protein [Myxococcales bacterium]|nr:Imm49 family immunity protein [Myxococcales bacterium]
MPLNSIPNEVADSLVVLYAPRLSDPLPARRYEAHLALGALAWRAGHGTVMREHLLHTAELGASMLETAGPLPFADPWELALPVLCAVVFGDDVLRQRWAAVKLTRWRTDETASFIDALDAVRSWPPLCSRDVATVRRQLAAARLGAAPEPFRPWLTSLGHGLLSIASRDVKAVEWSVGKLLALHRQRASEGDWQFLVQGLVAWWPLAVMSLAQQAGLSPNVHSRYLPPHSAVAVEPDERKTDPAMILPAAPPSAPRPPRPSQPS